MGGSTCVMLGFIPEVVSGDDEGVGRHMVRRGGGEGEAMVGW